MAKEPIKYFIERTTPLGALARFQRQRQLKRKYQLWKREGGIAPMPNLGKQRVVIDHIRRFSPEVFIETGTYKGKMVYAVMPYVDTIHSIELDSVHCHRAQERFAGYPNIHIIHGQSGEVLPEVLNDIEEPCLFWLDAHWSGGSTAKGQADTPIIQEMSCIFNHARTDEHVILIDDARCFTGENDYPTLEELKRFVLQKRPDCVFEVKDDIIRIYSEK
jgi:hypothetical protein